MIKIQLDKGAVRQLQRKFGNDFQKKLSEHLDTIVEYAENQMGRQARADVYSYVPKTNAYRRTGRLLGGRGSSVSSPLPAVKKINRLTTKITADPRLKGAGYNYAPIVAKQKFRRGNFFENTLIATKEFVKRLNSKFKL
jgi:hypothetical protein